MPGVRKLVWSFTSFFICFLNISVTCNISFFMFLFEELFYSQRQSWRQPWMNIFASKMERKGRWLCWFNWSCGFLLELSSIVVTSGGIWVFRRNSTSLIWANSTILFTQVSHSNVIHTISKCHSIRKVYLITPLVLCDLRY